MLDDDIEDIKTVSTFAFSLQGQFHNGEKTLHVQKGRENYCTTRRFEERFMRESALHCTEDSVTVIPAFQ